MSTFVNDDNDNWVLLKNNKDFTDYYLQDSVIREYQNIKVWVKRIYNQGNEKPHLSKPHNINKTFDIIDHSLVLYSFDYLDYKYCIERILHYNSNDVLLVDVKQLPKCKEIKSDSVFEYIFTQIINRL